MLDNFININPGKYGEGFKKLKKNDWYFKSHFVNEPIMPGTLQIEAMLQTIVAIVYLDKTYKFKKSLITKTSVNFFSKIDKPGLLNIRARIIKNYKLAFEAKAEVYFNKKKKHVMEYLNILIQTNCKITTSN